VPSLTLGSGWRLGSASLRGTFGGVPLLVSDDVAVDNCGMAQKKTEGLHSREACGNPDETSDQFSPGDWGLGERHLGFSVQSLSHYLSEAARRAIRPIGWVLCGCFLFSVGIQLLNQIPSEFYRAEDGTESNSWMASRGGPTRPEEGWISSILTRQSGLRGPPRGRGS